MGDTVHTHDTVSECRERCIHSTEICKWRPNYKLINVFEMTSSKTTWILHVQFCGAWGENRWCFSFRKPYKRFKTLCECRKHTHTPLKLSVVVIMCDIHHSYLKYVHLLWIYKIGKVVIWNHWEFEVRACACVRMWVCVVCLNFVNTYR